MLVAAWPGGAGTGALLGMLREILSQIASPSSQLDREMLDDMLVHLAAPASRLFDRPPTRTRAIAVGILPGRGAGGGGRAPGQRMCV